MKTFSVSCVVCGLVRQRDHGYAIRYLAELYAVLETHQRVCSWVATRTGPLSSDDRAWLLGILVTERDHVEALARRLVHERESLHFAFVADAGARSAPARP